MARAITALSTCAAIGAMLAGCGPPATYSLVPVKPPAKIAAWQASESGADTATGNAHADLRQVRAVMREVNGRIAYRPEAVEWWPTTAESFDLTAEDCDGQAIAKAAILWARGVAGVYLLQGEWLHSSAWHMVCIWWPAGSTNPWVLDNGGDVYRLSGLQMKLETITIFDKTGAWALRERANNNGY